MKRIAMMWRFKEETADYYKDRHLNAWPELNQLFKDKGFHNTTIWTAGNYAFLYGEIEGDDLMEAMAEVNSYEIKQKWQAEMDPLLEAEAIPGTGQQFLEMEQIWLIE